MASTHVTMPISRVTKDMTMTLTITGMRVFRWRLWLGMVLIRLAGLAMPFRVDVQVEK